MVKDERYIAVQSLIETDKILSLKDIFIFIPKTILARDLKQNYRTFAGKVENAHRFTIKDITWMAYWIDVPPSKLFELALKDMYEKKKKKVS
jgi:hypothetical protein